MDDIKKWLEEAERRRVFNQIFLRIPSSQALPKELRAAVKVDCPQALAIVRAAVEWRGYRAREDYVQDWEMLDAILAGKGPNQ